MSPDPSRAPVQFSHERRADVELVVSLMNQSAAEQGRVLATFRSWPGPVVWSIAALGLLLWFGIGAATHQPVLGAVIAVVWALAWVVLIGVGALEKHRVCEHGMVVGTRTASRYVIPYSTLDPGRVTLLRGANMISRYTGVNGLPQYRIGILATRAVALNGIDTGRKLWLQRRGVVGAGAATGTPFANWYLGTRNGNGLLEALERAMVADGYAATGLARRAAASAVRLHFQVHGGHGNTEDLLLWRRQFDDPPLGVDGPAPHASMVG